VYIKLSLSLKCKAAIFFALFKVFINALSRMQQRVVGLQQFTLSMCFIIHVQMFTFYVYILRVVITFILATIFMNSKPKHRLLTKMNYIVSYNIHPKGITTTNKKTRNESPYTLSPYNRTQQ
jgi:hypothetical protein